jgi:hypothetical protein
MILNNTNKMGITHNLNTGILPSVVTGYLQRLVGATIVHNDVFPILICLRQHALNTFGEVLVAVIYWR